MMWITLSYSKPCCRNINDRATFKSYLLVIELFMPVFFFLFRVCEQQIMTRRLHHTTLCSCLIMRAAARQPAQSARSTRPVQKSKTMTTSMTGGHALKNWLTSTAAGTTEGGALRMKEGPRGGARRSKSASRFVSHKSHKSPRIPAQDTLMQWEF